MGLQEALKESGFVFSDAEIIIKESL